MVVALIAIPVILRSLGAERFGILALTWVLLGYLGLFDLGISRATAKYGAEALAARNAGLFGELVRTSLLLQLCLGAFGGLGLALTSRVFVSMLNVPDRLIDEAQLAIIAAALALPASLAMTGARAALEASQRFDMVNAVAVPSNAMTYVLSAVGAWAGLPLGAIVILLLLNRVAALMSYLALGVRLQPEIAYRRPLRSTTVKRLVGFGGWITVTSIAGPALQYADRFLIAATVGLSALAYYVAPFDVVTRLWIVPNAIVLTLFPALSALGGVRDEELVHTYVRIEKNLFVLMFPMVMCVLLFGDELLAIWLGLDFANKSAAILKILAVGVLANSVSYVPLTLIQSTGRPDVTARIHVGELGPYLAAVWLSLLRFGLVGAAIVWTLRAALELALFMWVAARLTPSVPMVRARARTHRAIALVVVGLSLAPPLTLLPLHWRVVSAAIVAVAFTSVLLRYVLDARERGALPTVIRSFAPSLWK
jgi:O-antigen/teichoic acid export membrane protein